MVLSLGIVDLTISHEVWAQADFWLSGNCQMIVKLRCRAKIGRFIELKEDVSGLKVSFTEVHYGQQIGIAESVTACAEPERFTGGRALGEA